MWIYSRFPHCGLTLGGGHRSWCLYRGDRKSEEESAVYVCLLAADATGSEVVTSTNKRRVFEKRKLDFRQQQKSEIHFFSFQILRPRRIAILPAVLINPLWISLSTSAIARGFKMACLSWHLQDKHCGASWDKQDRLLYNVLNIFVSSRLYHCCDITSAFCFSVSALLNCSHSKSDGRPSTEFANGKAGGGDQQFILWVQTKSQYDLRGEGLSVLVER